MRPAIFRLRWRAPGQIRRRLVFPALLLACTAAICAMATVVPAADADSGAALAGGADGEYVAELVQRARAQRLAEKRTWHVLLHYKPNTVWPGVTSEADGPGFFLAPTGQTSPQAELEATLAAFFTERTHPPADMTAQCTFPARYAWLAEQLGFDAARLPVQDCPRFEDWRRDVAAESVSLIFSSYYLNNPASAFGHTLLRYNRAAGSSGQRLLDRALNYAADVPPDENGVVFAWRGIFGGYLGFFSMMPYHLKVKEYNDIESRDLWEYRLHLTPAELDMMLRHTWEMGSTYFDYYFFDENCSYHLLSLLEAARPSLRLTDGYPVWTLPADTVKQLTAVDGLVAQIIYHPSRSSRYHHKTTALNEAERGWLGRIVDEAQAVEAPGFVALPQARQALVLDAGIDFIQFKASGLASTDDRWRHPLRTLLLARSRLGVPSPALPPIVAPVPPHLGHDSVRAGLAFGGGRYDGPAFDPLAEGRQVNFTEFLFQGALHDLMSQDAGYARDAQVNAFHLRVRAENDPEYLQLEQFTLIDVVSLFPLQRLIRQPSWRLDAGWQRNRDIGCERCVPFRLRGGIGASAAGQAWGRHLAFVMVQPTIAWDGEFDDGYRAGMGLGVGWLWDLGARVRLGLMGDAVRYPERDGGEVWDGRALLRIGLSRNGELRAAYRRVGAYGEAQVGMELYF